eukprot:1715839-Pyramimonas_sp.AAC.1
MEEHNTTLRTQEAAHHHLAVLVRLSITKLGNVVVVVVQRRRGRSGVHQFQPPARAVPTHSLTSRTPPIATGAMQRAPPP